MRPADPSPAGADDATSTPSSSLVLVVDDDPGLRRLLGRILERGGWQVVEAADGRLGLELYLARWPAIAFVDLVMPGLDGTELLRAIRAAHPEAKLIAMSGAASLAGLPAAEAAREAGADAFVAKPLWPHTVLEAVRAHRPAGAAEQGEDAAPAARA